jgi:hypothetical protein
MRFNLKRLLFSLALIFIGIGSISAQANSQYPRSDSCYRWRTQIDASTTRMSIDDSKLTDEAIQEGIGCLLKLKGNKNESRFTGPTRANLKSADHYKPPKRAATIELAALYYASYLFFDNWQHADSIKLYEEDTGKTNSGRILKKAYDSYDKWFKVIREIGLKKARQQKIDPLAGSGISWS